MQLPIDFTPNKLAYLQQDLRKAEDKLNKALLSIRAYKGHKTKRKKLLTIAIYNK
jgi:hypothetical protein